MDCVQHGCPRPKINGVVQNHRGEQSQGYTLGRREAALLIRYSMYFTSEWSFD